MVTDYARPKRPPKRNHKRALITVIIILMAILFPLTMYYFRFQKVIHNRGKAPTNNTVKAKEPLKKPKAAGQQFDFYTLLPKMGVPVPTANPEKTKPRT